MKKNPAKIVLCLSSLDFDALAAALCITKLYPGTVAVKVGGVERPVQMFLSIYKDFIRLEDFDEIDPLSVTELFIVDTRPSKKLYDFMASFPNLARCIVFDHHDTKEGHKGCIIIQKEVGSTTTILIPLLKKRKIYISPQEATVMLTGIYEDTATLISPTTTPEDLRSASYLLSLGGNLQVVRRFLSTALDQRGKDVLKLFLDNIEVVPMGGILVAISCVRYKAYVDNLAFITHKLFDLVEADAIFTATAMAGSTHFVGRSLDDRLVDAAKIMSYFGGGGHKTAAAAKIKGELAPSVAFYRLKKICEEEITPPPTVTTIMSSPVKTIDPDTSVEESRKIIQRFGHGGLPIVNDGRLIGIVTRRDLDRVPPDMLAKPIKRFMTSNVLTIEPGASIVEARRLMMKRSVGRLPVVSDGQVVGIVTRSDVLKASFWHRGQDMGPFEPPTTLDKTQTKELFTKLPQAIKEKLASLIEIANQTSSNLYLVGGAVRDMVMGREPTDLDLLVEGDAVSLATTAHQRMGGKLIVHERFGTARLAVDSLQIDMATARAEYYAEPGAHPKVQKSSIREDLLRRDFTINAIALGLNGQSIDQTIDFCGGLEDIASKKLKVLHNLSFIEDPSRILRAVYYSTILGFSIEASTKRLAQDAIKTGLLSTAKNERTGQELEKILVHPKGSEMLLQLEHIGGLSMIFGSVSSGLRQQLRRLEKLADVARSRGFSPDIRVLRLLAVGSQIDSNILKEGLSHLRMPGKLVDLVERCKDDSNSLGEAVAKKDKIQVFKILQNTYDCAIVYACLGPRLTESLKLLEWMATIRSVKLEITGNDLLQAGIRPGKTIGDIIQRVQEEKVAGRVAGFQSELELARRLANE